MQIFDTELIIIDKQHTPNFLLRGHVAASATAAKKAWYIYVCMYGEVEYFFCASHAAIVKVFMYKYL